jgi:chorismate mutase/prephenate dehydratase
VKVVAFQGERGAYSENAVFQFFGANTKVRPCKEFKEVFDSVCAQETEFGIIPVENSLEGSVSQNYDLFLRYDLKTCAEVIVKVEHCLIANPGTSLEDIKVVYSHPQALGQCRSFLEEFGRELISTYDTAGSVKMIKEKGLRNAAAIASERAASIYDMHILSKDIADNPENFTRFFVLSTQDAQPTAKDKTSIIFSTKHEPGSLYHALGEFAKRDINLTKIESRPTRKTAWEYNFYLDFEGHRTQVQCVEALKALEKYAIFVKILGSYPKAT